ncbi:MAG: hypothetical protein EOP53_13005 [Sphingobacteriales bacterium]|nr:MAG: hypothetical protein EOP53_13005 [Sphingobacteriales bacterium]
MVITKHFLSEKLGLDFEIAQFFADRKVPANNLYWKGRFLYLSFGTGFLFIPIIMDAIYKSGVDKKVVMDPERIHRMEQSFDIVMQYERKRISFGDYIKGMSEVFLPHVKNHELYDDLLRYFKNETTQTYALGTSVAALDRADAFLFSLTDLPIDHERMNTILRRWYYLAVAHLMLDDFVDLDEDREKGEENALIDLGDNKAALQKCQDMLQQNIDGLKETNELVAAFFQKIYDKAIQDEPVQALNKR